MGWFHTPEVMRQSNHSLRLDFVNGMVCSSVGTNEIFNDPYRIPEILLSWWKYPFKISVKSVNIRLVDRDPPPDLGSEPRGDLSDIPLEKRHRVPAEPAAAAR